MIENIYFSFGLLIILSIVSSLVKFKRIYSTREWKEKFEKISGRKATKNDFRTKSDFNIYQSSGVLSIIELIWVGLGLFSSVWYIFISIVIFTYLINFLTKPIKWTFIYKMIVIKHTVIRLLVYSFLFINNFHLKINLIDLIKSFL